MKSLSEEVITEKARVEIIAAIAIQVYQHTTYPTSDEYTGICRKLIERYPFLKDKVGNGIVSSDAINYNIVTSIACLTERLNRRMKAYTNKPVHS